MIKYRSVFYAYWMTVKCCIRSLNKLNIGDHIIYKGERYRLTQGVSDPFWNFHRLSDNSRLEYIDKSKFKKIRSLRNWVWDIKSTWSFYSVNWHRIWFTQSIGEIKAKAKWFS